jgi:hypothetical protein
LHIPNNRRVHSFFAASWVCCCALLGATASIAGCSLNQAASPGDPSTVSADDVLRKCGTAYQSLKTLQASGTLRDYREGTMRNTAIRWDFARPDKCRLQLGTDVAIVSGSNWWTYDAAARQYRKHNQFTRTPVETAAYLLSKGVPFMMPALLTRGQAAFAAGRAGQTEKWQLQGVGWHANAPCYVLTRRSSDRNEVLRVWIDQDSFLLRGWMISVPARENRERPVLECDYTEQVVDGRLPSDWLQLKEPMPATSRPATGE